MNTTRWVLGLLIAGMVAGTAVAEEAAGKSEAYYVVKTSGMDRKVEMEVLSEPELRDLEKTLKLEQKHFSKAVILAGKEWASDEMNKGLMFPGSTLKPRSIVSSMKYPSLEKAQEKLIKLEGGDTRKNARGQLRPAPRKPVKPASKRDELMARAADLVKFKIDALISETPAAGAAPAAAPAAIDAGGAQNAPKADL